MPTNSCSDDLQAQRPRQLRQSHLSSFLVPVLATDGQGIPEDDDSESDHATNGGVSDPPPGCVPTGSLQEEESICSAPSLQRRPTSLTQCILEGQLERSLLNKMMYRQFFLRSYKQVFFERLHSIPRALSPESYISGLELDHSGQLIVSTDGAAMIAIHNYARLVEHCQSASTTSRAHSVAWNPRDENWIAAAGSALDLYDIEYTQGSPTTTLQTDMTGHVSSFTFIPSGPFNLAVSRHHLVDLWDLREKKSTGTLRSAGKEAVECLQATRDSQAVLGFAGSQVLVWDMRRCSQWSLTLGGNGPCHGNLLGKIDLESAFLKSPQYSTLFCKRLPGCILLNPADENLLGFTLFNGTAGVLDISRETLTHLTRYEEGPRRSRMYAPPFRCITWSPCGNVLLLGRLDCEILGIDITAGEETAVNIDAGHDQPGQSTNCNAGPQNYTKIPADSVPSCLAVHPSTLDIVAGGEGFTTMIFTSESGDADF